MTDALVLPPAPAARRGTGSVVVTGAAAASAYGRGTEALLSGVLSGRPAFAPVQRFDVSGRRVGFAAAMPGLPELLTEVTRAAGQACDDAGLSPSDRARSPLFLAIHGDPAIARAPEADKPGHGPEAFTAAVAGDCGLAEEGIRCYTSACVAASTAIADAAAIVARGHADRVVVAGGYLVDCDQFALFDAGRVLADDGQVRPFSTGRRGLLLGDGVGAVVIESGESARARRAPPLARLAGWGRTGDAYHPVQPHPEGHGMARRSRPRCSGPVSPRTISATSTPTGQVPARATRPRRTRCGSLSATPSNACRSVPPSRCMVRAWKHPACWS